MSRPIEIIAIVTVCWLSVGQRSDGQVRIGIATFESVQDELKLDEQQVKAITAASEKALTEMKRLKKDFGLDLSFSELRALPSAERQKRADRMRPAMVELHYRLALQGDEEAALILQPEQLERLRQITVQAYVKELHIQMLHPKLSDNLGLTEQQNAEMASIRCELSKAFRSRAPTASLIDFAPQIEDAKSKIMNVFTPEQAAQLEKLQGEPFEFQWEGDSFD